MNTKNINTEIDLYSIAMIIFKNKIKLFLIVIIGIILAIIHEINEKPFTPIYELTIKLEENSLMEQQKYDQLNNNIKLSNSYPKYFRNPKSSFEIEDVINEMLLNKFLNPEKQNEYDEINSKLLLSYFSRFLLDELQSSNFDEKFEKLEVIEVPIYKSDIGNLESSLIQIKLVSDNGDLETWKEFFLNQYKKVNENVRVFLFNKLEADIINMQQNYDYYLNEIKALDTVKQELKNLSNNFFDRQLYFLNNSPLNNAKNFKATTLKYNSINIKIINTSEKNLNIKTKIFIYIILSVLLGVILILLGSALKRPK